jgi:hypothetical protein
MARCRLPLRFVLIALAGWMNQRREVIDSLQENRARVLAPFAVDQAAFFAPWGRKIRLSTIVAPGLAARDVVDRPHRSSVRSINLWFSKHLRATDQQCPTQAQR